MVEDDVQTKLCSVGGKGDLQQGPTHLSDNDPFLLPNIDLSMPLSTSVMRFLWSMYLLLPLDFMISIGKNTILILQMKFEK